MQKVLYSFIYIISTQYADYTQLMNVCSLYIMYSRYSQNSNLYAGTASHASHGVAHGICAVLWKADGVHRRQRLPVS